LANLKKKKKKKIPVQYQGTEFGAHTEQNF
jgi:hypothetical protein